MAPSSGITRLGGGKLNLPRVLWAGVILLNLAFFVLALPETYRQISTLSYYSDETTRNLVRQGLAQLGLTPTFLAVYFLVLIILRGLGFFSIVAIIFRGRPDDWMALVVSLALLAFANGRVIVEQPGDLSRFSGAEIALAFFSYTAFVLLFYVFPTGRFIPAWTRWPAILSIALTLGCVPLAVSRPFHPILVRILIPLGLITLIGCVGSLGYRYRNVFDPVQRQQTRWCVFGLVIAFTLPVLYTIPKWIEPSLQIGAPPGAPGVIYEIILAPVMTVLLLILPASFAIAIFRYRLWDIDLIINRTLVYVSLTAILAGLYSSSVTLFQRIFMTWTGQKSDAAIVLSTLVLASTFTPIKNGLQASVDRRFKEPVDPLKGLKAFEDQVLTVADVINVQRATRRLLETVMATFHIQSGAVYLEQEGKMVLVHATPGWKGEDGQLNLFIEYNHVRLGMLALGSRAGGTGYSPQECQELQQAVNRVAEVIWLVERGGD